MEHKLYTISEITSYIKGLFGEDPMLNNLWLTGEISNFSHPGSGHMYFTLKDDSASINSVIFRGNNSRLKYEPEDGLKVNAHGYISIYERRGAYQFYIDKMEPAGMGALYLAFEQLKNRLEEEGLFDEEKKKKIPLLPKKIGIITSPTGAAIRDILSVVNRRFEGVSVLIVPSLVQGDQAAYQIQAGIKYLNDRDDIDLIIVSRGGGSLEDLWPFNEEVVARAIYNSRIPIISGVGHETDFTIADFTADLRAPTPSAAAELAISSRLELENNLKNICSLLYNTMEYKLNGLREKLTSIIEKQIFTRPKELLSDHIQLLDELTKELEWEMERKISRSRESFKILNGKLDSLSPLKTLARGYTLTSKDGEIINKVNQVEPGDRLETRVQDGSIYSRVEKDS